MNTTRVLFVEEKYNRNSLVALAGALEKSNGQPIALGFVKARSLPWSLLPFTSGAEQVVLAFSFHTLNVIAVARSLAQIREVHRQYPFDLTLLAGGAHPSGDPVRTLRLGFDFVLRGEAEESLPIFLRELAGAHHWGQVPGLVWRDAESVQKNPLPAVVDLDRFAPFSLTHRRFGPIEVSRGCPCACHFCATSFLLGRQVRHRSVEVVAHHAEIAKAHGLRDLRFVTPNAFAFGATDGASPSPASVEALLLAVGKIFGPKHIYFGSFPAEVRPETVTPELVRLVSRLAGNDNIVIGAQSGSDRMLERLHRGHTIGDVFRAVELIRTAGLKPIVDFIFGLPGETPAEQAQTWQVMADLIRLGAITHGHTFMPLPGTPLADAPPGSLGEDTRRELIRLAGTGAHMGQWQRQEREGRLVAKFLAGL